MRRYAQLKYMIVFRYISYFAEKPTLYQIPFVAASSVSTRYPVLRHDSRKCCSSAKTMPTTPDIPRVECHTTPNPLSRKFQGPQFLENNQVVEIKNEEQAFECSSFVYDIFIASKSVNQKDLTLGCCGNKRNEGSAVKSECCAGKTIEPMIEKSITRYYESNESPIRSLYITEHTMTINIKEGYISDRFSCAKAENSEKFEAYAHVVWNILKNILAEIIEKHIVPSSDKDCSEKQLSGFVQTLDPTKNTDKASKNLPESLWSSATEDTEITYDDSEPVMAVKELIRQRVKPILEQDGGSCRFLGMVEEDDSIYHKIVESQQHSVVSNTDGPFSALTLEVGSVLVLLEGACVGCPSSSFTLKNGVQRMLTHWVPEVTQVVEVNEDFARSVLEEKKKLIKSIK